MGRTSKNLEGGNENTTFYGTKNLEPGISIKGTYSKRFEKKAVGPGGPFQSVTYFIDLEDGSSVGFNKLGNLGYLMDRKLKVKEGEVVEIEYNGKDDNEYHNFDVSVID